MRRAALALLLALAAGCGEHGYCIDCFDAAPRPDGGPIVDGGGGGGDGGGDACVVTSIEVCNGLDDDCNGVVDDDAVGAGDPCGIDIGICRSGTTECVDGAIVCGNGAVLAQPEACNGLDDDCDGTVDDGNPGGGVVCGTEIGDCQRGITSCTDGAVVCVGEIGPAAEACDGRDNDCDGVIDNGDPEGGVPCGSMGSCLPGLTHCLGGVVQCIGGDVPSIEVCDGADNDCDGMVDEDFDLANDPYNCGSCGNHCTVANGVGGCSASTCEIAYCFTDFWDRDGLYSTGCEYSCSYLGAEVCDGLDDDCDGMIDEGLTPPPLCQTTGACAGTTATCTGAPGWKCLYGPTVSTDATGAIVPETRCDGIDNDCDGAVDETFPLKGMPCTSGSGTCMSSGTYVCNATGDAVMCNAPPPGGGSTEVCDGVDNDCDGLVDEGNLDDWIEFNYMGAMRWIYKYEASRPDATATSSGSASARPCSKGGVLPWTNITQPDAEAKCMAIGARLCYETEWQTACQTAAATPCLWSFDTACTTYSTTKCNGNDYDFDASTPGDQDGLLATGNRTACYADWGTSKHIFDLSGNVKEWAVERSAGVNPLRGGSYSNTSGGMKCNFNFTVADDTFQFENVGFRCCRSTAPPP